jgi:flagellar hook protein FlgE
MVRSLYAGISGLRNHQVAMDVTGNNIANVNTTGFKAGRVSFKESMAQLLRGASRPAGNAGDAGGTNPMQLGLGMAVGSIDTMLVQGNLQSTGKITDLALEGSGFLVYSSGEGNFYSRNGALQMDANGKLVSPTNGFKLQGMMAANDGTYPPGSRIGDIRIPYGEKAPAKTTDKVQYGCNLDSDSEGLGTVAHTNRFLATTTGTDTLTSLYDQYGNALGIRSGDTITIAAEGATTQVLNVADTSTIADLVAAINLVVRSPALGGSAALNAATLQADGTIQLSTAGGAPVNNLRITSSRPTSNSYVANAFNWGPSVTNTTAPSAALRSPATASDAIANLYDASGNALGLESGDPIRVNGDIGGKAITTQFGYYLAAPAGATEPVITTMQDLLDLIQGAVNLPQYDGTPYNNLSVSVNNTDTPDDRIPDGSIAVRGQQGEAFSINNISITAVNSNQNNVVPTRFNSNMVSTEIQHARDVGQHSTSITVYDESGDAHVMTTTFTHSGIPGEWLWEITMEGGEEIQGGNTGRISFGQDGTPSSFTFDDSSTSFRFDPMNGSNEVEIRLDVGAPGSFGGITQFRSPSTTAAKYQNGYPMGKLQEISIDDNGEIQGLYTNGVNKSIARIYVAEFNNAAGLFKEGDSMYGTSNNSGDAVMLRPGIGTTTKIKPGALEMSNVELATEFTNMITTQRGYQANARVITTSDNMLQELVQLVR